MNNFVFFTSDQGRMSTVQTNIQVDHTQCHLNGQIRGIQGRASSLLAVDQLRRHFTLVPHSSLPSSVGVFFLILLNLIKIICSRQSNDRTWCRHASRWLCGQSHISTVSGRFAGNRSVRPLACDRRHTATIVRLNVAHVRVPAQFVRVATARRDRPMSQHSSLLLP